MAVGTLSLPREASPQFLMERPLPFRSHSAPESTTTYSNDGRARLSSTTLKYSQKPLPTPDSAGFEGYQMQFTLMPPTPGDRPASFIQSIEANKAAKRRSQQQLPYLFTVEDDDDDSSFSPSSTNYSATSEFGPFSRHRDTGEFTIPPVPSISEAPAMKTMADRKKSRLSIETSSSSLPQVRETKSANNLVVHKSDNGSSFAAPTTPITPVTPGTPMSPYTRMNRQLQSNAASLAERRAQKGNKLPQPLTPSRLKFSDESPPLSPPPLTSRSAAHVEAGMMCSPRNPSFPRELVSTPKTPSFPREQVSTPRTPGFPRDIVPKQEVSTPRSANFPTMVMPGVPGTPQSATFFSPRSGTFPNYVPHSNAPNPIVSPRGVAFSPIHEDVDREGLRSPVGVNMLIKQAQESQDGFLRYDMPHTVRGMYEMLWQVANAQLIMNDTFRMNTFRQDSFTYTGAEHFTFGPDASAPFYRLSAHPSHQQDAIFSDLKIHRCNPATTIEVPVIHLQLEAPKIESSGIVALIYPQVAALMLENQEKEQVDIKEHPKFDVGDEAECCRLVFQEGQGFALYHPFNGDEGSWLSIEVDGRVGFDVIGANGKISISSSTHEEPLVILDFATGHMAISAAACATVPSFYIVDVAVAAVLTVATVEGRRLRAIQEDLDQIHAYELNTPKASPEIEDDVKPESMEIKHSSVELKQNLAQQPFDYSFATAVGRASLDGKRKKKNIVARVGKALVSPFVAIGRGLSSVFRKMFGIKPTLNEKITTNGPLNEFDFPFQNGHGRSMSFPPPPVTARRR